MVNTLKYCNYFGNYFKYKNSFQLKSFRRNSFNLFFVPILKQYRLYLNNISMVLANLRVKNCYYFLLTYFSSRVHLDHGIVNFPMLISIFHNVYFFNSYVKNDVVMSLDYSSNAYTESSSTLLYNSLFNVLSNHFLFFYMGYFSLGNLASLPTVRKHFTVLRSPHTDKKSREQFVFSYYNKLLSDGSGIIDYFFLYFKLFFVNSLFIKFDRYCYNN